MNIDSSSGLGCYRRRQKCHLVSQKLVPRIQGDSTTQLVTHLNVLLKELTIACTVDLGHVQIGRVTAWRHSRHCQDNHQRTSLAPLHLVAHDGNPDAVGSRTMLFFRRYPRFTFLPFPSSLSPPSFYSHTPPLYPCSRPLHHQHRLNPSTLPFPPMGLPRVYDALNAHTRRRCSLGVTPSSPKWDLHPTMFALCVLPYFSLFFFFC